MRGHGTANAKVLIVGEAPGQTEDRQGEPFIGESGKLLRDALAEVGVSLNDVYITNAVKCATENINQPPNKKTINFCRKYLVKEIEKLNPNVIATFGAIPLDAVLRRTGITKLKNNIFQSDEFGVKVIPVYHPAYILRNPGLIDDFTKGVALLKQESESHKKVQKEAMKVTHWDASSVADIDSVLDKLEACDRFVFDLETSHLEFTKAKILCIAISWAAGIGVTIKWDAFSETQLTRLSRILNDKNKLKINQNIKFDLEMLKAQKIEAQGPFHDTLLEISLIDENMKEKGLDALVLQYLDIGEYWKKLDDEKLRICKEKKIKKKDFTYDMFEYKDLSEYAQWDADATFRIEEILYKKLGEEDLQKYYKEHSIPTMELLVELEYQGVLVDRPKLRALIKEYKKKLKIAHRKIRALPDVQKYERMRKRKAAAKIQDKYFSSDNLQKRHATVDDYIEKMLKEKAWVFNQRSVPQLAEILFQRMQLEPIKFSKKTKNPSTDKETLNMYAKQGVVLCDRILEYRGLGKYISTYLVSTYKKSKYDSRIHANYLQWKARTGRLACVSPNMQNMPKKAKDFKECLIADPGYVFVKGDLKQAEFRCWANYSNDPDMLRDIASGMDVHRMVAAEVFKIPPEEVTKEQRDVAKATVFGQMYGRGAHAIAEEHNISIQQATYLQQILFKKYPIAKQWLDDQIAYVHEHGYVKTWLGRYRRLPKIFSDEPNVVAKAERDAMNSPIQGLASNMNDHYMYVTNKLAKINKIDCYPAVTQHDAQIFLVREADVKRLVALMKHVVQKAFPEFKAKMELDFEVGKTLGTLEPLK